MRSSACILALLTAAACSSSRQEPPPAQTGSGGSAGSAQAALPAVPAPADFPFSGGTPEARAHFKAGLAALHSFWYDEATKEFNAAIAADATFKMAYWGLAMSHAKLLWGDDDIDAGQEALKRMPQPQTLPPHDQAWVVAALTLFRRANPDVRTTRKEFLGVMEQIHQKFPDDESATFLALALLSTIHPNEPDETAIRKRAGALAEAVFERNPTHPGAAHYIIHAYDTVELAKQALPAAQAYAKLAPEAFHAQHMPAHIYVRLGMWKDAVASCQAAWDASAKWIAREHLSIDHEDFHSLAWLVELDFERGRRKDADAVMKTWSDAIKTGLSHDKRAAYANQVGSYLARTGEWKRVDELLAPLSAPAVDDANAGMMGCTTMSPAQPKSTARPTAAFEKRAVLGTRALAAAFQHDSTGLAKLLAERDKVDNELHPFLVATQTKEFVDNADRIRGLVKVALVARAKGDDKALVAALAPLAIDQQNDFIGEGIPGGILQSEQIAEAELRLGDAKAALEEFKGVLTQHMGRGRSMLGAARSATKAGDSVAARGLYQQLVDVWRDADDTTEGLAEARKAVASSKP